MTWSPLLHLHVFGHFSRVWLGIERRSQKVIKPV